MRVTLSHITAAYHWLMTSMDGRELAKLERHATLGACPTRACQLARLDLLDYEIPDHMTELLTTDSSSQPARSRYRYRTSCKDYPTGSFVALDAGIQIVSPELSFWQMSKVLPLGELVKYANALCGLVSYTLDDRGRLTKRAVPLTTSKRLAEFARAMGNARTNPAAFRALKYVVDRSESPMENCITVLLCLKRQYGGFGFRKPVMGYVVELDEAGRQLAGSDTCRCDMYWSDANYDLEYDSDQEHGPGSATHDSMRRTAIKHMGITIGELRYPQVKDANLFVTSAHIIAREIGHEIHKRSDELEFKYMQAYLDLRAQLFWWERAGSSSDRSPLRIGELDW